jgi:hypothetical protein
MSKGLLDIFLSSSELRTVKSEETDFTSRIVPSDGEGLSGRKHFSASEDVG